jgi:hypothetical protein
MTTHTDETIASAVVLACLLIALFAILLAGALLFLLTHMGAASATNAALYKPLVAIAPSNCQNDKAEMLAPTSVGTLGTG